MKLHKLFAITSVALLGMATSTVTAQTILIDIGQPGAGFVSNEDPLNGTVWNNLALTNGTQFSTSNAQLADLNDTDGNSTGISFNFQSAGSSGIGAAELTDPDLATAATNTGYDTTALRDTAFVTTDNSIWTVEGLNTASTYDFSFFAGVDVSRPADSSTWEVVGDSNYGIVTTSPNSGFNTVSINDVTPDGSGVVTITFDGSGSETGHWNTLEIAAVPEPSSAVLIMVAAVSLSLLRRRRRA